MSDFKTNNIPDFGSISASKPNKLNMLIIQGFYDSIDEFIQYFSNSKHSTCPISWNDLSLACSCNDCQISSNNCTCVKCFLEGPHKYHRCSAHLSSSGNCDCGDYSSWNPSRTFKI